MLVYFTQVLWKKIDKEPIKKLKANNVMIQTPVTGLFHHPYICVTN